MSSFSLNVDKLLEKAKIKFKVNPGRKIPFAPKGSRQGVSGRRVINRNEVYLSHPSLQGKLRVVEGGVWNETERYATRRSRRSKKA